MSSDSKKLSERYKLPGVFSDPALQNIAALAADICDVPTASIQLVDEDFVWILAKQGDLPDKIDRDVAFCDVPVRETRVTIINNLAKDSRFASNPAVVGSPNFRFYAGFPLMNTSGTAIGTLCVLDTHARELDDSQRTRLKLLSEVVVQLLDAHPLAKAQLETEKALEKERSFLTAVLENLTDGVVVCDSEGKLTLFNRALKEFHGLDSDASLDPSEWSHHYKLYRNDGTTLMELNEVPLMRAFTEGSIRGVEMVIAAKDHAPRRFLASGSSLFDKDGRKLGAVCTMHDITEIKQKEADLIDTNRALQNATNVKSQFLATMSHEIRTPLNGIVGMTELLKDSPLSAQQLENLEIVQMSAESLISIVNDILDISKIEAGRLEIESHDFDFVELIESLIRTFQHAASQKGLELQYSVVGDLSRLTGDANRLRQVLTNLLANAIKFTAQGKILLEAHLANLASGKSGIQISIRDTGIGIADDVLGRLFRPFSQADSSTTRKFGGTGLGLSISKNLVQLMGGEIGVRSTLGQGSEFWITLTMDRSESKSQLDHARVSVSRKWDQERPKLHVLLAEDNSVVRSVAVQMLSRLGIRVDTAVNGVEALRLLSQSSYDIIFMDCQMPEMDGFEATGRIRALNSPAGKTPIIALTANAMEGDRDKCLAAGMTDYISKPFRLADLRAVIERVSFAKLAAGF